MTYILQATAFSTTTIIVLFVQILSDITKNIFEKSFMWLPASLAQQAVTYTNNDQGLWSNMAS